VSKPTPEQLDDVLPQTQCGLCSYDGCLPYASAIANQHETITLCEPGGVETLRELAKHTQTDASPFIESVQQKYKPPMLAKIREDECIGCTKCITACPVDAIIGTNKQMHSVIDSQCTGCELCVAPCPVDCIDMIEIAPVDPTVKKKKANLYRTRYRARNERIAQEKLTLAQRHQKNQLHLASNKKAAKQRAIQEMLARTDKKNK
jgi:Na+-translocating ferredoxin:NAD+ oxidoreductase subunit B